MEGDDIRQRHGPPVGGVGEGVFRGKFRISLTDAVGGMPGADGERLDGVLLPGPDEGQFHQIVGICLQRFIETHLDIAFREDAAVGRLVVEIPDEDPFVIGEGTHQIADVTLQLVPLGRVSDDVAAWTCCRLTVVNIVPRWFLATQIGMITRKTAVIHQGHHHADIVFAAQGEELRDPCDQAITIMLPDNKRQIGAQGVVAQFAGPGQLLLDDGGIEGLGLPHLGPVDRRTGQVVEAQ
ncbi:hypothetical protein D3C86_1127390 [compost metagenome]